MTIGTKTLLFGAHWPAHPVAVAMAWRFIYGTWPTWREAVAIALHDVGYFGCTDIENGDGLRHPEGGARIVDWLVGKEYGDLVRGHSGGYADLMGLPRSKLYAADKCAFATEMGWLYLWRCGLTGELAEYRAFLHGKPRKDISQEISHREWFLQVRARMVRGGLTAAIEAMDPENRTGALGR